MLKFDVERVKFLSINIDIKTFDRLIRTHKKQGYKINGVPEIQTPLHYKEKLEQEHEFIRLKCHLYYLDFKVREWKAGEHTITIFFGELIDCNKGSAINRKNNYKKRGR